jgi:hydrogenase maturation factor
VGLDATVLDIGSTEEYLVAKSDPVTLAMDEIGWYAVHVNANDIACMGARPRWFLATLLLPPKSLATQVERIFRQVFEACESLGVALVGGHTEMSYGLERPLVAGTMLGTVPRDRLVTPERAEVGDRVVIAKHFPIEATAIIAHERASALKEEGWLPEEIEAARRFLWEPGISVVRAARVAADAAPLHGMHDPTEGGLATGLRELAHASGLGIEVEADALPMLELSRRICKAMDINPLGAIASGALLIVVAPEQCEALLTALEAEGIPATVAGRMTEAGSGEWLVSGQQRIPLPDFPVDEITKLF